MVRPNAEYATVLPNSQNIVEYLRRFKSWIFLAVRFCTHRIRLSHFQSGSLQLRSPHLGTYAVKMLNLAAYIMMPFMAHAVFGAPTPQASGEITPGQITTSIPPPQSEPVTTADNLSLIASLETAASAVDRLRLLNNSTDHVFDFNNLPSKSAITTGNGGEIVRAFRKVFPALTGNGVSMTVGFIGPCGFNTPHTHPRSAEVNIIVEGELGSEFVLENGAPVIRNRLSKYQMTVFPQGAIHTEFNPNCDNAVFVAGFASEDPGLQQVAQRLFDLDDDLLQAEFGNEFIFPGEDIDQFRAMIPENVANGVESCLTKCGIQKK